MACAGTINKIETPVLRPSGVLEEVFIFAPRPIFRAGERMQFPSAHLGVHFCTFFGNFGLFLSTYISR